MKMYFVCRYDGPQWWYCMGVLSNGFHFGGHVCSEPDFAPSDLYFRRKERISALKELFDIDEKTIETETITVESKIDVPDWWESLANNKKIQESFKTKYEKYGKLIKTKEKK